MEVLEIPVERVHPNAFNVNRMGAAMQKKLAAYLRREGFVEPLVVRPHPKVEDEYELLGGEHRWRIAKEVLEYKTVPCVVVTGLDEKRARILSVNLNEMSGASVPSLLSKLLSGLSQEMTLPDLEATLPYDAREIQDALSLMQLPTGLADDLEDEAEAMDKESPVVVTVVLDKTQAATFEQAMEKASDEIGKAKDFKARALTRMAESYLAQRTSAPAGRVSRERA
jgi:ParB-like chromosome segregation protein Spo0J